jgi:large subunit ribosomal protein L35
MPSIKMKTHKGVKKRFKVTASGKVMHKRCGSSHLNSHKSGKQIRRLRKKSVVKIGAEAQRLRRAVQTHEVIRESGAPKAELAGPDAATETPTA